MATVIAEIRLAPGEVGYYDDYSRIYLNSARPTAKIYAGMNTTQIRRSIRSGRLRIISGSLEVPQLKQAEKPAPKTEAKKEAKPEVKPVNEPVKEEPVAEPEPVFVTDTVIGENTGTAETETAAAETVMETPEEIQAEVPVRKRRSRKKAE